MRNYILIFAFLATVLTISVNGAAIAESKDNDTRILNGRKAEVMAYPYQVSLQRKESGTGGVKFCGGEILNKRWILTAAHCLEEFSPDYKSLFINAGIIEAYDYGKTSQFIQVERMFSHPKYDKNTILNDIALLKLKEDLKFNQYVQPISLPPKEYVASGEGLIMGWGTIDKYQTYASPELLVASTSLSDPKDCHQKLGDILTENQICVGSQHKNNACFGDSGGPFVQTLDSKPRVIGVLSYGNDICVEDDPVVFTKVTSYLDFIKKTMESN